MNDRQKKRLSHDYSTSAPSYLSARTLLYALYILGVVFLGLLATRINPLYLIGVIVAGTVALTTLKYPFFGLLIYLTIYFLRPGERFLEAIGALRIEFLFGAFLLAILLLYDGIRGRGIKIPKDEISVALLYFICVLLMSTFFSEWKTLSWNIVFQFLKTIMLYYYILILVNTERRFRWTLWLIVGFTAFIGCEATFAYYQGDYDFVQGIMRIQGQTYGDNYNSLSMYMASTIPLLIYLIILYRHLIIKLACMAAVGICMWTMIITGSRSGLLGLIGATMVYIWHTRHRVAYMVLMVIGATAVWMMLPSQYQTRYGSITSSEIDESSQGRLDAWVDGLVMFAEKPILGVGPGVFTVARGNRFGVWLASHSLYIEMLATIGILGTAAWGLFLLRLIRKAKRLNLVRGSPSVMRLDLEPFVRACYAVLAGLLIAGVFGHILMRDTWYFVAALVIVKEGIVKQDQAAASDTEVPPEKLSGMPKGSSPTP